jgi:hypothetical protein
MRLLNVYEGALESGFQDEHLTPLEAEIWSLESASVPKYAILSHRWLEGEEVTFDKVHTLPKGSFRDPSIRDHLLQPINTGRTTSRTFKLRCSPKVVSTQPDIGMYASSIYKIAGACKQVRQASDKTVRHVWIDTICIGDVDREERNIAINPMFR